jgi:hypothetical protein
MIYSNKHRGGNLCHGEDPWPKVIGEYLEYERPFKRDGWFKYVHMLTNGYHSCVSLSFT